MELHDYAERHLAEDVGRDVETAEGGVGGEHLAERRAGRVRHAVGGQAQLDQRRVPGRLQRVGERVAAGVADQIVTQDEAPQRLVPR